MSKFRNTTKCQISANSQNDFAEQFAEIRNIVDIVEILTKLSNFNISKNNRNLTFRNNLDNISNFDNMSKFQNSTFRQNGEVRHNVEMSNFDVSTKFKIRITQKPLVIQT